MAVTLRGDNDLLSNQNIQKGIYTNFRSKQLTMVMLPSWNIKRSCLFAHQEVLL